jgi:hypothetical protein
MVGAALREFIGQLIDLGAKGRSSSSTHASDLDRRPHVGALGDRYGEPQALGNLGNVYADQGRFEDAIANYERSLATCAS